MFGRSPRQRILAVALALGASTVTLARSEVASAQPSASPTTDPKEMARKLGEEALALHGQGRFRGAYERFETADKIVHSPVFVLWMARSKRALGELVAAKRLYQNVIDEPLGDDASAKWISARDDAKTEIAAVVSKIPHLKISVTGASGPVTVDVDGVLFTQDSEIEIDPGKHIARATVPGKEPISKTISLDQGQAPLVVMLSFADALAPRPSRGSFAPGAATLAFGIAGLTIGAVTGGVALSNASDIKSRCVGNQCERSDQSKASTTKTLAAVSTTMLVFGGVASTVGVVLLVARPRLSGAPANLSIEVGPARAGMTLDL